MINPDRILETLIEGGADYCDVRKEKWDERSRDLKDGEIERMTRGVERGAMVRVLYEGGCARDWSLDNSRESVSSACCFWHRSNDIILDSPALYGRKSDQDGDDGNEKR